MRLAKFQDLQTGLVAAQRAAKDLQSENAHLEGRMADLLEQLEMATLDREMAEEKVELGANETLKMEERIAELEVEVAVLREENGAVVWFRLVQADSYSGIRQTSG